MGDFNIDYMNNKHANSKMLSEFLSGNNLSELVRKPTHFTGTSETLLDLCVNAPVSCIFVDHVKELSSHAFIS